MTDFTNECANPADYLPTRDYIHEPVSIPKALLARLMAAIETPDDLTDDERTELLDDAEQVFPRGDGVTT